ncbi:MAG: hypothetical protein IJ240_04135 [Clostridia bacterium]|nr:hypothetical protein [Clostridia bacterium]
MDMLITIAAALATGAALGVGWATLTLRIKQARRDRAGRLPDYDASNPINRGSGQHRDVETVEGITWIRMN